MSGARGSKKSIWDTRFSKPKPKKALAFDECLKVAGFTADEWKTIKGAKVEIGEGGEILHGMKGKFKNINDIPRKTVKQREGENIEQTEERAREVFAKQDAEKRGKTEQEYQEYLEKTESQRLSDDAKELLEVELNTMKRDYQANAPEILSATQMSEDAVASVASDDFHGKHGFCASYCLAYVARTQMGLGVDVGREETRQAVAQSITNLIASAGGSMEYSFMEKESKLNLAKRALSSTNMELGKEYAFVGGDHAAIVRLSKNSTDASKEYEYLELQSKEAAGWHPLTDKSLETRFKATRKKDVYYKMSGAVEIGKLAQYQGTKEILPYVNNREAKK